MHVTDMTSGLGLGSGFGSGTSQDITTEEAIDWLTSYKSSWENRDVEAALALFVPDVRYAARRYKHPLFGHSSLRSYFRDRVMGHQRDVRYEFELWGVKNNELMARWNAVFTWLPINGIIEMDGVCNVVFARREDGKLIGIEYSEWFDQTDS